MKNEDKEKSPEYEMLPTIQGSLNSKLEKISESAKTLASLYSTIFSNQSEFASFSEASMGDKKDKKRNPPKDGHDAYCLYLKQTHDLIDRMSRLFSRALSDAHRFKSRSILAGDKNFEQKAINEEDLKDLFKTELTEPIRLTNPQNGDLSEIQTNTKETALVRFKQASHHRIISIPPFASDFNVNVVSNHSDAAFMGFEYGSEVFVVGEKQNNQIRVSLVDPLKSGNQTKSLLFSSVTGKNFLYFNERFILINKGSILMRYFKLGDSKSPVWDEMNFDINGKNDKYKSTPIITTFEASEKVLISQSLFAAVSKDRKSVFSFKPDKVTESNAGDSAVTTPFDKVTVFSLYQINSQKRSKESVLFVSEADGTLYALLSSQEIPKAKPKPLVKIQNLVDLFYVEDHLWVLLKVDDDFLVEFYKVNSGDAGSATFTLEKQPKKFEIKAGQQDFPKPRLAVLTELPFLTKTDPAEAKIFVFGADHYIKFSTVDNSRVEAKLFDRDFAINSIFSGVSSDIHDNSSLRSKFFLTATTVQNESQQPNHLISLEFNHLKQQEEYVPYYGYEDLSEPEEQMSED